MCKKSHEVFVNGGSIMYYRNYLRQMYSSDVGIEMKRTCRLQYYKFWRLHHAPAMLLDRFGLCAHKFVSMTPDNMTTVTIDWK